MIESILGHLLKQAMSAIETNMVIIPDDSRHSVPWKRKNLSSCRAAFSDLYCNIMIFTRVQVPIPDDDQNFRSTEQLKLCGKNLWFGDLN